MTDQSPSADSIGIQDVLELMELITQTDISELCYERGGARVLIKREIMRHGHNSSHTVSAIQITGNTVPEGMGEAHQHAEGEHLLPGQAAITAPFVGTFYAAPSPKDRPYIEAGDIIEVGDPVGIIEAMKMMNEIKSEVAGRVAMVHVKNAQPVEYGQILMVVEAL